MKPNKQRAKTTGRKSAPLDLDSEDNSSEYSFNYELNIVTLNKLIACFHDIRMFQEDLAAVSQSDFRKDNIEADQGPWPGCKQERVILRQRHAKERNHQLNRILADIAEVVSREVGLDQVDRLLYPERYEPKKSFKNTTSTI